MDSQGLVLQMSNAGNNHLTSCRNPRGFLSIKLLAITFCIILTAVFAYCPDSILNLVLGNSESAPGIYEEQVLDPEIAEDPDRNSQQNAVAQNPTAGTQESIIPLLRSIWWSPLVFACLIIILSARQNKKAAVESEQKSANPEAQTKPRNQNKTKAEPEHKFKPEAAPASSPADSGEISQKQLIKYAEILSKCKKDGLLNEEEYKALHKALQALDESGKKWTVNLKTKEWFKLENGKWVRSEAPEKLFFSAENKTAFETASKKIAKE